MYKLYYFLPMMLTTNNNVK